MGVVAEKRSGSGSAEGVGRETRLERTFLGQPPIDAAISTLAAGQHGVLTLAQLRAIGLSASATRGRAASARLHRIHRGVYALAPPPLLSREGRWMAAVLVCGPGAALSHRSAAALHELRATDRARIDVTVPGRASREHGGIDVHRSKTLMPEDTTEVNRIACTTVARTQLDLAEAINRRALERAYDQAEILEVFDLGALHEQLARNTGRHAIPRVRAILDEHHSGATPTWSELEERFLELTRSARVPEPQINAWITPADGEPAIRVDFIWRAQRLVVETDGHRFHRTRRAFEADRRRDQRLTVAGWRIVRVTWRQLIEDPAGVACLIAGLLV
jgi:predicted transcriptional regulator of viral defense system